MPKCPNCGQETARTEDWACQWCGYPLLSDSYKKIEKTYKQLQEEKRYKQQPPEREEAEVPEPEPRSVPPPEPKPAPPPEPEPVPPPEPEPAPPPEPVPPPEPEPAPPPAPAPAPPPEPQPAPPPEPVPAPPPEPVPAPPPEPVPAPPPEPVPAPPPEPQPAPAPPPEPNTTPTEIKVTVEELNSAYKADKPATDAKFKNKIITVAGVIDKIVVRQHLDIQYILLTGATKQEQWNVRCSFDQKEGPNLNRLAPGQTVTVQGRYDGYERNIIISDCVLLS